MRITFPSRKHRLETTRSEILLKTEKLLYLVSPHNISFQTVAAYCGVSKTLLRDLFGDLDKLIRCVARSIADRMHKDFPTLTQIAAPLSELSELAHHIVCWVHSRPYYVLGRIEAFSSGAARVELFRLRREWRDETLRSLETLIYSCTPCTYENSTCCELAANDLRDLLETPSFTMAQVCPYRLAMSEADVAKRVKRCISAVVRAHDIRGLVPVRRHFQVCSSDGVLQA